MKTLTRIKKKKDSYVKSDDTTMLHEIKHTKVERKLFEGIIHLRFE